MDEHDRGDIENLCDLDQAKHTKVVLSEFIFLNLLVRHTDGVCDLLQRQFCHLPVPLQSLAHSPIDYMLLQCHHVYSSQSERPPLAGVVAGSKQPH